MRMNVNEYVWVKLTEPGKEHLGKKDPFIVDSDVGNGWHKFQMWEFMETFGDGMYLGSMGFFEGGDIYFTKPMGAKR